MDIGNSGHSVFTVDEFDCRWPKAAARTAEYSIELCNTKWVKPRDKVVKKLFYPNINERLDVDGFQLGWENKRSLEVPRSTRYKISNDCILCNYTFHYENSDLSGHPTCLVVET